MMTELALNNELWGWVWLALVGCQFLGVRR